jgi:hypothetical protein
MKVLCISKWAKAPSPEERDAILPKEVPATLKLYLDGVIEQMWFKLDAPGVVFLVNAESVDAAKTHVHGLPMGQAGLMDFDFTARHADRRNVSIAGAPHRSRPRARRTDWPRSAQHPEPRGPATRERSTPRARPVAASHGQDRCRYPGAGRAHRQGQALTAPDAVDFKTFAWPRFR